MGDLSATDVQALCDFAVATRDAASTEAFGAAVLAPVGDLVAGDRVTYNEIDVRRHRVVVPVEPADAPGGTDPAAFTRYVAQRPLAAYGRRTGDASAHTISDFLTSSEFRRTDRYAGLFRPTQVEQQIAVTVAYVPGLVVGVALNRAARTFDERDRLVLNLARGQLVTGYQAAAAATEREVVAAALDQALEDLDRGVILVRRDGRVAHVTSAAVSALETHLGMRLESGGRLPSRLARLVDRAPGTPRALELEGPGARIHARLLGRDPAGNHLVVLDVRAGERPPPLGAAGLTARETDVLRQLAEGRSNAEIARHFQISVRTVHKHLEHLYAKLGVQDRTAAATCWLRR